MATSYLDFEGVYDKSKRYIVKNWSDEDYTQEFGAEVGFNGDKMIENNPSFTITIKAGEMRELDQFQAYTIAKHFVTREMFKDAAKKETREKVDRAEMGVNNPELRKPYEEKTISEIKDGKTTPFMDSLREEIRAEEIAKLKTEETPKSEERGAKEEVSDKKVGEFVE